MKPPPLLANAYAATGTGEWCLDRSRSPVFTRPRRAVYGWLRDSACLAPCAIGKLVGKDHSTIIVALRQPLHPGPYETPTDIFNRCHAQAKAALGVLAIVDIWERYEYAERSGGFLRSHKRVQARRLCWRLMRKAGLSYPQIAKACGLRSWTGIVEACREDRGVIHSLSTRTLG